jgi:hypothetical protein
MPMTVYLANTICECNCIRHNLTNYEKFGSSSIAAKPVRMLTTFCLQPESRGRRAQAALNHPNIGTIYAIASENGADFIPMEWVPGKAPGDRAIINCAMR